MHPTILNAAADCSEPKVVRARLARLMDVGADLSDPALAASLVGVLLNSAFLAQHLARHPADVAVLRAEHLTLDDALLDTWFITPQTPDEAAMQRALRRLKARAFLWITAQDVAHQATVARICAALSAVARFTLDRAVAWARASVTDTFGPALDATAAPIPFVVMGMGKLGGDELNYSSDIDLLYLYGTDEGQAGTLTVHQHFAKICTLVGRLIGQATEDGFVFRVDLDLRPEGRGGPICNALPSAERYYEAFGRTWERIAWLRAQPVAGDLALGHHTLMVLEPWIYRRTLDLATFDEIREIKRRILQRRTREAVSGRAPGLDLKLDWGGIRAIEFFVNTLQLAYGGRLPRARDPSTLGALTRLLTLGLIDEPDRDRLVAAYTLFRQVEHRVQMMDQRQTHRLPQGDALDALARRLGFSTEPGPRLRAEIDRHRAHVGSMYDDLLGGAAPERNDPFTATAAALLEHDLTHEVRMARCAAAGLRDPNQAVHLLVLAGRHPHSPFSPTASATASATAERLLADVLRTAEPERALQRLATFAHQTARRPIYMQGIAERPHLGTLLCHVFASSDFLSERLLRNPSLVDALFDPQARGAKAPKAAVDHAVAGTEDDLERFVARLSTHQQREVVHLGLADLAGELDGPQISHALSALAEATLQVVFERAQTEVARRFGRPSCPGCVVALGKLGGAEMSYGSDLDVIFLYAHDGCFSAPNGRQVSHLEWFTKVAQRTIALLGLPTPAGALYAIDTRLRPGGRQGTLVARLQRFVAHHQHTAATWERAPLVKARPVAGPPAFMAQVRAALDTLNYGRPMPQDLRPELARLRARMEMEIARETQDKFNPKSGRGGLVDIEFIAQAAQLEHGGRHPTVRTPNTQQALQALGALGVLPNAPELLEAWRFLRRLDRRLRIMRGRPSPELRTEPEALARVALRLGYPPASTTAPPPGEQLLCDYLRQTRWVRAQFEMTFKAHDAADPTPA